MKLKRMAHKNPLTTKPLTHEAAIIITTALITIKNKPRVSTVMGNVSITKMGFTNQLSTPNAKATHTAVIKSATSTPGKSQAVNMTDKLEMMMVVSKPTLLLGLFDF